jgi:hypothetical protein
MTHTKGATMSKLMYRQGNLFTGYPWAVQVEEHFGSTEIHGPFSSENEAWNYGMGLAHEADLGRVKGYTIVRIETPHVASIVTHEDIRRHREEIA